jgi:hypothetical protein
VAARWIAVTTLLRTPLGIGAVTLEGRRVQQNRGKRIPEVMRHDTEHLIAELGGIDGGAVEPCVLDLPPPLGPASAKARRRSPGP